MMKNDEFVRLALQAAEGRNTYLTGGFGQNLNYPGILDAAVKQYAINKQYETLLKGRISDAEAAGESVFGFDCICLIKGILWGWTGDKSKPYGGAVYLSNGVPDLTVGGIFDLCQQRSDDFSNVVPGEMLYYGSGSHAGIYIGGGYAVEATAAWDRIVAVSAVGNMLDRYPDNKGQEKIRSWKAHGRLPWVEYTEEQKDLQIICPCCGKRLKVTVDIDKA